MDALLFFLFSCLDFREMPYRQIVKAKWILKAMQWISRIAF